MPSEVWKLYEANPRDFTLLSVFSAYRAEREARAREEADLKAKQGKGVKTRTIGSGHPR